MASGFQFKCKKIKRFKRDQQKRYLKNLNNSLIAIATHRKCQRGKGDLNTNTPLPAIVQENRDLAQMVERSLSMREALGSMPRFSNFFFLLMRESTC